MTKEEKEVLQAAFTEAKFSVIERMKSVGWISDFTRTGNEVVFTLTDEGRAIMHEIERLFFQGGKRMSNAEMNAFCRMIDVCENL